MDVDAQRILTMYVQLNPHVLTNVASMQRKEKNYEDWPFLIFSSCSTSTSSVTSSAIAIANVQPRFNSVPSLGMFILVSSSTVLMTDEYGDSSVRPDSEGTTPVHASEASASVLLLARLLVRYESDRAGVEMAERKFIRWVFHF